jgi:SAM-dependent methyltransferase
LTTSHDRAQTPHSVSERLLLFLSRKPGTVDYEAGRDHWAVEDALSQLCRVFPNFHARIVGKEILDLGCGTGYQTAALARMGAKHVVGLDTNRTLLETARKLAGELDVTEKVEFIDRFEKRLESRFDIIISQNSMEHFKDPAEALNEMKAASKDDGVILISFGPPWFAPFGSHMHFFVKVPWVNVLFDEETVLNVRSHFRNDGATRYEQVEGGLNKMSVAKFERLIRDSGLRMEYKKYDCVKGINFIAGLPLLRELFVNNISCRLVKTR